MPSLQPPSRVWSPTTLSRWRNPTHEHLTSYHRLVPTMDSEQLSPTQPLLDPQPLSQLLVKDQFNPPLLFQQKPALSHSCTWTWTGTPTPSFLKPADPPHPWNWPWKAGLCLLGGVGVEDSSSGEGWVYADWVAVPDPSLHTHQREVVPKFLAPLTRWIMQGLSMSLIHAPDWGLTPCTSLWLWSWSSMLDYDPQPRLQPCPIDQAHGPKIEHHCHRPHPAVPGTPRVFSIWDGPSCSHHSWSPLIPTSTDSYLAASGPNSPQPGSI